jgi:hypothetical protein
MIQMQVTPDEALKLLSVIPHKTCQKAAQKKWVLGGAAGVTAQSICWLYCWAETGLGSREAAQYAQQAFKEIFGKPYYWFGERVSHEWARIARYKGGDIESELMLRFTAYEKSQ